MWRLKSCPRCKGDMMIDRDSHGWFGWCLQCGYQREFRDVAEAGQRAENGKRITQSAWK